MKKILLVICLLVWQFNQISAQEVAGGVFEILNGESTPLAGANVMQFNTLNGTTTDSEGYFVLTLEKKAPKKLVVSYVSYQSDTVNLNETGFGHVHVVLKN